MFLSQDYMSKTWTGGVEWKTIKALINKNEGNKICLINVDNVDIDTIEGLSSVTDIAKKINTLSDSEVAVFFNNWYESHIV